MEDQEAYRGLLENVEIYEYNFGFDLSNNLEQLTDNLNFIPTDISRNIFFDPTYQWSGSFYLDGYLIRGQDVLVIHNNPLPKIEFANKILTLKTNSQYNHRQQQKNYLPLYYLLSNSLWITFHLKTNNSIGNTQLLFQNNYTNSHTNLEYILYQIKISKIGILELTRKFHRTINYQSIRNINDNQWHHVAICLNDNINSAKCVFYIDGILDNTFNDIEDMRYT